ncbi:hypothetical protein [Stutzerimonas balearica]|uniref:hypothetical protein n=1 Tax=Stutzerimonas balearica TaxID=74829 RepID=UPI0028A0AD14|nr:hypothetical protein [Stutzerimonas balearica]
MTQGNETFHFTYHIRSHEGKGSVEFIGRPEEHLEQEAWRTALLNRICQRIAELEPDLALTTKDFIYRDRSLTAAKLEHFSYLHLDIDNVPELSLSPDDYKFLCLPVGDESATKETETARFVYSVGKNRKHGSVEVRPRALDVPADTEEKWRDTVVRPAVYEAIANAEPDYILKTSNGWYYIGGDITAESELESSGLLSLFIRFEDGNVDNPQDVALYLRKGRKP